MERGTRIYYTIESVGIETECKHAAQFMAEAFNAPFIFAWIGVLNSKGEEIDCDLLNTYDV